MTSNQGINARFQEAVDSIAKYGVSIAESDIVDTKDQVGDDEYDVLKRDRNLNSAIMTLGKALASVDVLIGCSYPPAWVSKLGEGDPFTGSSWITTAPSSAGAPIGAVPMGLVDGLPVGLGVVAARNNEVALVRAMALIKHSLNFGILKPTFSK